MTTVLVWLLISLPADWDKNRKPAVLVERFATVQECDRVKNLIDPGQMSMRCVQASVVKL